LTPYKQSLSVQQWLVAPGNHPSDGLNDAYSKLAAGNAGHSIRRGEVLPAPLNRALMSIQPKVNSFMTRTRMTRNDPTRLGGAGEIAEEEATGAISVAYRQIRNLLNVPFVPTVYRLLASHERALVTSVEWLTPLLNSAEASRFGPAARQLARDGFRLPPRFNGTALPHRSVTPLLNRYGTSNPANRLFALGVLGTDERIVPDVMSPPMHQRPIDADIC